jgi:hypothetical protein
MSPSFAAYSALGQLAERLGKSEEAQRYQHQAMLFSSAQNKK